MKNIHILRTDKPSRLWVNNLRRRLELDKDVLIGSNTAQHIYITSDEEIKEGDWVYTPNKTTMLVTVKYSTESSFIIGNNNNEKSPYYIEFCKKIILTTDQDLIADGVQAIDDEFLQWFVKNPSCEEVEIEKEKYILQHLFKPQEYKFRYKIVIPSEEPKQLNNFGLPQFGTKEFNDLASQFFGGKPKQKTQGYICPQTKVQCNDEFCVSVEKCNLLPSTDVFSEPKQEKLVQINQDNPVTKGSTALVYEQETPQKQEPIPELTDLIMMVSMDGKNWKRRNVIALSKGIYVTSAGIKTCAHTDEEFTAIDYWKFAKPI